MKFFIRLAFVLVSTVILFECTGNQHMYKALRSTYFSGKTGPTIDDVNLFETRKVENGRQYHLEKSIGYDLYDFDSTLWEELESYDPAAYVVVHKGQIILEHYWDDYSDASYINSFSVAKSIIGLGVMKALQYDIIHSLDQKVIEFIPELKGEFREEVTIRHLMSMTSGINFDESYGNPYGFIAMP